MKKSLFLVGLLAVSCLILGCKEKEAPKTQTTETQQEKKVEIVKQSEPSVMLYEGWTYYKENEEGKMIASAQSEMGEVVKIWKEDGHIVEKKAIRRLMNGEEKELDFVSINADGTDYWTINYFVAEKNTIPGLIIEETRIFSEPKDTAIGKQKLETGTVVAVMKNGNVDGFAEIYIYDGVAFGKKVFVKQDNVNTDSKAIEVNKTQKKLQTTENLKDEVKAEVEAMLKLVK